MSSITRFRFRISAETAQPALTLVQPKQLFRNMNSAFAQHKIITNENGDPVDYVFLDVNPKFEELTGLKKEDILKLKQQKISRTMMVNQ